MGRRASLALWNRTGAATEPRRGCNPRPRHVISVHESEPRRYTCANYNRCLDYAAERHWRSFDCEGCATVALIDAEQNASDVEAMANLVRCVYGVKGSPMRQAAGFAEPYIVSRGRVKARS